MEALSLLEYNTRIKQLLYDSSVQSCWVTAETTDLRVSRGHCYLELIQKDDRGVTVARLNAVIWANTYVQLAHYFKRETGKDLASNMKVMVKVTANFHEQYGLKAMIDDIDPKYTLGDMERIKREILAKLEADGIIDMNKQLPWRLVPQRIAVISARGAAGYGDFMKQLHHNDYGLKFYTCLFEAVMQGENCVPSVISALDRIAAAEDLFDCVVIIRGGGSTTDLKCFDSYNLASFCAQFPLPILAGIGHTRDVSVVDMVANDTVKTPTDAAQFIIDHNVLQVYRVSEAQKKLYDLLNYYTLRLRGNLQEMQLRIASLVSNQISAEQHKLLFYEKQIELYSPEKIYKKGYSLVTHNGQVVRSCHAIQSGDRLQIEFADGKVEATVE